MIELLNSLTPPQLVAISLIALGTLLALAQGFK